MQHYMKKAYSHKKQNKKYIKNYPLTRTVPGTTCLSRTAERAALSASRPFSVSAGILLKAVLEGANTVKGPGEASVSTRPAADTAASRVENSGVPATRSTMVGCWIVSWAEVGPSGAA